MGRRRVLGYLVRTVTLSLALAILVPWNSLPALAAPPQAELPAPLAVEVSGTNLQAPSPTLTLVASAPDPYVAGSTQALQATLRDSAGNPLASTAITFTVTGPNARSGSNTTNTSGVATYSYTGATAGSDRAQAMATVSGSPVQSNVVSLRWLKPLQRVSITTVQGRFFNTAETLSTFNISPSQTPDFIQSFPAVIFNPGAPIPGLSGNMSSTHPFTNFTTDLNGNYTGGTIPAQGNGLQAFAGSMLSFNAVFTGSLVVATAGDVTFKLSHDDGFILGIGNNAAVPSGATNPMVGAPTSGRTAFSNSPVLGARNPGSAVETLTINFPAPGLYPLEIDYAQGYAAGCCADLILNQMIQAQEVPVPPSGWFTLSPSMVAPQPVGGKQTFTVTAVDAAGVGLANRTVTLNITGPNAPSTAPTATTDANGVASFEYSGTNPGTDTVQATTTGGLGGTTLQTNAAQVNWVAPARPASMSTAWGRFYPLNGSCSFNLSPSAVPTFSQTFPTIRFNPPIGSSAPIADPDGAVTQWSKPFTTIVTDANGQKTGTLVAQGNGVQAGNFGSLEFFAAVFTGQLIVTAPGTVSLLVFHDDAFILGIGDGAAETSTEQIYPSSLIGTNTAFEQLRVVAAYNADSGPVGRTVNVTFPAAGTYRFELDYTQCQNPHQTLVFGTVAGDNEETLKPTGSVALDAPSSPTPSAGTTVQFTAVARDLRGQPLPYWPVSLTVTGANPQNLRAITDTSGIATFSYVGDNPGVETAQAMAWMSGRAPAYSSERTLTWAPAPLPSPPLASPSWLGSPANDSVVTAPMPITLSSAVTLQSGYSLDVWPANAPSAVTHLTATGATAPGSTLATLDPTTLTNDSYIVQLVARTAAATSAPARRWSRSRARTSRGASPSPSPT